MNSKNQIFASCSKVAKVILMTLNWIFCRSMIDDTLAFPDVALTRDVPDAVQGLLTEQSGEIEAENANTAAIY